MREEDSGLHDIKNLAQSTKQRLSKRASSSPVRTDERDVLAASSGAWKTIALPEPAKMVSLPALDELPPAREVKAAARAAAAAPAVDLQQPAFSARFAAPKKSRAPWALAGVAVAAAAGVGVFFYTQGQKADQAPASVAVAPTPAPVATPTPPPAPAAAAQPAPTQIAQAEEPPAPPPAEEAKAEPVAPPPVVATKAATSRHAGATKPGKKSGKEAVATSELAKPEEVAPPKAPPPDKTTEKKPDTGAKKGEGEPSFDALLKEAGVDEQKKAAKPKLANKSLSAGDFQSRMKAIESKVNGSCYKGKQGTASFKLTIAPSGQVTAVSVTGAFAGKPEGDCVAAAVRGVTFPPWDGGQQSFVYSYLLAE